MCCCDPIQVSIRAVKATVYFLFALFIVLISAGAGIYFRGYLKFCIVPLFIYVFYKTVKNFNSPDPHEE